MLKYSRKPDKTKMIRKIIHKLLYKRHYWRLASFDEIAELYVSRLMTVFALNLVSMFAGIYLYKLGYSIIYIGIFYMLLYFLRSAMLVASAHYIARFGPKHSTLMAAVLQILSFAAFALVEVYGLPAVIIFGLLQKAAGSLYDMAYMTDFSKVRHPEHIGKELGMMQVIERAGKLVAPFVGGLVASLFSLQITIIVASLSFLLAALPLLRTAEPIKLGEKISYRSIKWRDWLPSMVSYSALGYAYQISTLAWGLFLMLAVFRESGQGIYAIIGTLSSLSILLSMYMARMFGKLVDRRKGRELLTFGAFGNSLSSVLRAFVDSALSVVLLKVLIELSTSASRMSIKRVVLDIADSSGQRLVYLSMVLIASAVGSGLACLVMVLLVWVFGPIDGLKLAFMVAGLYQLLLLASRKYKFL